MTRVEHFGHGFFCYLCRDVYDDTDGCDHPLRKMAGVEDTRNGYRAQPADLGHHGSHVFVEIEGMQQCSKCDRVKIPDAMVGGDGT